MLSFTRKKATGTKANTRRFKPAVTSEADIERTCTELLEWDGWCILKTNPCSDRSRGKGFGEIGMADCLYLRYGRGRAITHTYETLSEGVAVSELDPLALFCGSDVIAASMCNHMWIEWKREGGYPTPKQQLWHLAERKRGALTLVAGVDFPASIEGFREWYSKSGLRRLAI